MITGDPTGSFKAYQAIARVVDGESGKFESSCWLSTKADCRELCLQIFFFIICLEICICYFVCLFFPVFPTLAFPVFSFFILCLSCPFFAISKAQPRLFVLILHGRGVNVLQGSSGLVRALKLLFVRALHLLLTYTAGAAACLYAPLLNVCSINTPEHSLPATYY